MTVTKWGRIVEWIGEKKRLGKKCTVRTTASNAVRIARTAQEMGQSLEGAKFVVSGEPLTESKRACIEKVEGHAIPCYGCAGLNQIGYGCGNPRYTDDLHVSLDILAVIQQPRPLEVSDLAIRPFLFTTLSSLNSARGPTAVGGGAQNYVAETQKHKTTRDSQTDCRAF